MMDIDKLIVELIESGQRVTDFGELSRTEEELSQKVFNSDAYRNVRRHRRDIRDKPYLTPAG